MIGQVSAGIMGVMLKSLKLLVGLHAVGLGVVLSRAFAHGGPTEVKDKWLRNIGAAQTEMKAGVDRVQQAPGAAAAAKKQKWVNALQDPAVQDKWARNVASVDLPTWKKAMNDYGIQRVAQGAQAKQEKFLHSMESLLPFIDGVRERVRSMDDTTPEAREQRALAMMRGMRDYRRPA